MKKIFKNILLIIICLGVGVGIGVLVEKGSESPFEKKVKRLAQSEFIPLHVFFRGNIVSVSEHSLSLKKGSSQLEVRVPEGAEVAFMPPPGKRDSETIRKIKLSEVKKGHKVNIYAKMTKVGELIAITISTTLPF